MKILILLLISFNAFSQIPHTFSSGEIIDKSKIDDNFRHLENYATEYSLPFSFGSYNSENRIKASKFNQDIDIVNNKVLPQSPMNHMTGNITATKMNNMFINAKAHITSYIGKSCKDLLDKNTSLTTNGFYKIKPTDSPSEFWSYCDMQNGGWTLIFDHAMDDGVTEYSNGHPVFSGDHNPGGSITVQQIDGNTVTIPYSDMQKAVKYVKGIYVRYPSGVVAKSSAFSSFGTKYTQQTPWDTNFTDAETPGFQACNASTIYGQTVYGSIRNIIYTPTWLWDATGTYTYVRMVAGCHRPDHYDDELIIGIGVYAATEPVQTTYPCSGTCYKNYITGQKGHRGGTVRSQSDYSTWIK